MHFLKGKQMGKNKGSGMSSEQKLNIYRFAFIMLLLVLIIVVVVWAKDYLGQSKAEDNYETLQNQVNWEPVYDPLVPQVVETETQEEEPDIWEQLGIEVPEKNLNWDDLKETNSDIYAWLYVPGTDVDYPVLQHPKDDNYYLKHNLDGSSGYPGCIYTQSMNRKDFTDFNTVMYGHNMRNGSMFATLHNFEDATFFNEHPYMFVYTENETLVYQIYIAYVTDDAHILLTNDFSSQLGVQAYLDKAYLTKAWSGNYREDINVTTQDRILTLSTCVSKDSSKRYLVQGILLNTSLSEGDNVGENQTEL